MNKFEKVSLAQFFEDRKAALSAVCESEAAALAAAKAEYDHVKMPRRATQNSAGYDICTPYDLRLLPGESCVIPTGLRVQMDANLWLGIYIRSSLGFKFNVRLKNSVAVIDADYYGAKNEGHLKVGIYNGGDQPLELHAGDAFCQGIFQPYFRTDDDEPATAVRVGGFGSTNQ